MTDRLLPVEVLTRVSQSYYRVAANLGDADAQQDLAFCLANGRGCKRDKKEAAKWYRAAVSLRSCSVTRDLKGNSRSRKVPATLGWHGYTKTSIKTRCPRPHLETVETVLSKHQVTPRGAVWI